MAQVDLDVDPRYRCCCGFMHVKTGVIIIGICELISNISVMSFNGWVAGFMIIISFVTVALLFCGICKTNPAFVIPYLAWQAVETVFLAVILVYVITAAIFVGHAMVELHHHETMADDQRTNDQQKSAGVVGAAVAVYVAFIGLLFGVHVWWFCLVRRLFEYLRVKRARMFSGQDMGSARESASATA